MNRRQFSAGAVTLITPFIPAHRGARFASASRLAQDITGSTANDLNDGGQIVGSVTVDGEFTAVVWDRSAISPLGALPGHRRTIANGINNAGLIVGESRGDDEVGHAVLWDRGQVVELACPDPDGSCFAYAINDVDHIVGVTTTYPGTRAVLWQDGEPTYLDPLPGDPGCGPTAINAAGQVVGWSGEIQRDGRPVVWDHGQVMALPTGIKLPGGTATAINRAGQIAGYIRGLETESRAVWWERQEDAARGWVTIELAGLPDEDQYEDLDEGLFSSSEATDINDAGQIVGDASTLALGNRAVLWHDGALTDLGTGVPDESTFTTAINNAGQIVGSLAARWAVSWIDGEMTELPILYGE